MIRQLTRPLLRPLTRPLVGMGGCERWVYNFDGVDDYAQFAEEIALTGDWFVEVACDIAVRPFVQDIISKELFCKISLDSGGRFNFLVGDGSGWVVTLPEPTPSATGLRVVRGQKVGNTYTLLIDGVIRAQVTRTNPVNPVVSHVGIRSNLSAASRVLGIIFNVNINGHLYPINNPASAIQTSVPDNGNPLTLFNTNQGRWSKIPC